MQTCRFILWFQEVLILKTAELCKQCDINYQGIAIGSWARKIVKSQIETNDFWENPQIRNEAIELARNLFELQFSLKASNKSVFAIEINCKIS